MKASYWLSTAAQKTSCRPAVCLAWVSPYDPLTGIAAYHTISRHLWKMLLQPLFCNCTCREWSEVSSVELVAIDTNSMATKLASFYSTHPLGFYLIRFVFYANVNIWCWNYSSASLVAFNLIRCKNSYLKSSSISNQSHCILFWRVP